MTITQSRPHFRTGTHFLVAAMATIALAGCGPDDSGPADSAAPVTITESVPMDDMPADVAPEEPALDDALPEPGVSGPVTVPNVVGMNHQLAQDTLQAAGFYLLTEVDGSGADRLLVWDRNWTTVEQNPPAGSTVSLDTEITLTAVKDGD